MHKECANAGNNAQECNLNNHTRARARKNVRTLVVMRLLQCEYVVNKIVKIVVPLEKIRSYCVRCAGNRSNQIRSQVCPLPAIERKLRN